MHRALRTLALGLAVMAIKSCALLPPAVREDVDNSINRNFGNGVPGTERRTPLSRLESKEWQRIYATPKSREEAAEARLCLHENSERRVVMQDGVEDRVAYRRCPVTPYADAGARLVGRGEF